jgi:hypothetical protein
VLGERVARPKYQTEGLWLEGDLEATYGILPNNIRTPKEIIESVKGTGYNNKWAW